MTFVDDLFSLAGKTVLLTGASAGLGRRFAETLSRAGATTGIVMNVDQADALSLAPITRTPTTTVFPIHGVVGIA